MKDILQKKYTLDKINKGLDVSKKLRKKKW